HSALVQPSVRRTLPRGFWVEGLVGVSRQWLAAPFDNYWEGGPKLAFGLDYGVRSSLIASYEWKPRAYDTREEVSLSGTNLPGTELKFQVHELELAWRHDWDEQRRWRTFTKLEMLVNRDSGPGYFDYQRYQLTEQLRYVSKQWEAR